LIFRVPNTDGPSSLRFAAPPIGEPYKLFVTPAIARGARPAQGDGPPLRAHLQARLPVPATVPNACCGTCARERDLRGVVFEVSDFDASEYDPGDFDPSDFNPCAANRRTLRRPSPNWSARPHPTRDRRGARTR